MTAEGAWSYPEPPPRLRGLRFLSVFGPGAILASATIGAGETILAVRAGAWAGYDLLWLVLLSTVTKSFFLLYLLGRYSAISGDPIARRLLDFPGPRGWLLVFILLADLVPAGPLFGAIAAPCGFLVSNHLGGDPRLWALALALAAIGVAAVQRYLVLERQQVVVCLVLLLCVVASTAMVGPDWLAALAGMLAIGQVPDVPAWARPAFAGRPLLLELSTVFGYAGNLCMGYLVYAEFVKEKRWGVHGAAEPPPDVARLPTDAENVRRARGGLRFLHYDLATTAALIFLVTAAFMIAGAVVLHPLAQMPMGFDLLSKQAAIFEAIAPALIPVYYVAVLFALWGTMNSVPEIYARVTHAFLGALFPRRFHGVRYETVMRVLAVYLAASTVAVIWFRVQPQAMMDFVALFSTNVGVALSFLAALWLDRRLPAPLRSSRWLFLAGVVSFLVVAFAAAVSARFQYLA